MLTAGQKKMNKKWFVKVWGLFGPMLFPPRCPVCDEILTPEEIDHGIHMKCKEKLYLVMGAVCMHCGRPLENQTAEYCQECQRKKYVRISNHAESARNPYKHKNSISRITQGKALYLYRGAIKKTMYRFKYSNRREYAVFFAKEAAIRYGEWIRQKQIDVIVPVPMYKGKQKKRGYNQAEVFAKELSKLMKIPMEEKLVGRIKNTIPQKELNDVERKNNLKNAFQIEKSIVQYSHILVVDDIYTTGSTAEAVAEEMIKIGGRQVYFLSICIGGDM